MLNPNSQIEQWFYTAGGHNARHNDDGAFDVWSKSAGISTEQSQQLIKTASKIFNGKQSDFEAVYSMTKELKPGAVPTGLFKKTYKENDYETKQVKVQNEITVVEQSGNGSLKGLHEYGADFRLNPEQAPYRIAATELSDGRLAVIRTASIGRVYSDMDGRMGNQFFHAMIFPAGTKLSDIDVSKLPFKKGLTKAQQGKDGEQAPAVYPTTTMAELLSQGKSNAQPSAPKPAQTQAKPQQKVEPQVATPKPATQTGVMPTDKLIELFESTLPNQPADRQLRNQKMQEFRKQVASGANVPEMLNQVKQKQLEQLRNGAKAVDVDTTLEESLQFQNTPYTSLSERMKYYLELVDKQKKAEEEGKFDIADGIEKNIQVYKSSLKIDVERMDVRDMQACAKSQMQYLANCSRFDRLAQGKEENDISGKYMTTTEYQTAKMIDRLATQMIEKNVSFDKQTVIR